MESFTERVITIIQHIPSGKVMTYGQIGQLAGSPRGARQVVRILHSSSKKHDLPWHRVINAKGEIGIKAEGAAEHQKAMLESEGITFTERNTIDLEVFRYHPEIF
ncbi:methylated-DNA-protein-cysteine methyltransferase related protein [Peribacillus simplex]|uniref:Methylated-DNA-protein-cysteine methyltransferase related protein n=2 Tax=Peribacillus simplex TaxID=1478 RepID=A0A9X8R2B3_9BACI|nr:MGMT family protein [Peribacillus simplex]SIQ09777.1 methylated-DNA-protein-cysteine methyltransferase related protein [Peribacillus simplex]